VVSVGRRQVGADVGNRLTSVKTSGSGVQVAVDRGGIA